jgi:hypothetical protein
MCVGRKLESRIEDLAEPTYDNQVASSPGRVFGLRRRVPKFESRPPRLSLVTEEPAMLVSGPNLKNVGSKWALSVIRWLCKLL